MALWLIPAGGAARTDLVASSMMAAMHRLEAPATSRGVIAELQVFIELEKVEHRR